MTHIISEERLQEIAAQLPKVVLNPKHPPRQPRFGWGDPEDLDKFVSLEGDNAYPLIWVLPGKDQHKYSGHLCDRQLGIIIATRETEKQLTPTERYELSFKYVLNPIALWLIEALMGGAQIVRLEDGDYSVGRYTDFSDQGKSFTIDLWDAIKLEASAEFNNHCINKIKWRNKQPTA